LLDCLENGKNRNGTLEIGLDAEVFQKFTRNAIGLGRNDCFNLLNGTLIPRLDIQKSNNFAVKSFFDKTFALKQGLDRRVTQDIGQVQHIGKKGGNITSGFNFIAETIFLLGKETTQCKARIFIKSLKRVFDQVTCLEDIESRRRGIRNLALNHEEHVLANILDDIDEKTLVKGRIPQVLQRVGVVLHLINSYFFVTYNSTHASMLFFTECCMNPRLGLPWHTSDREGPRDLPALRNQWLAV
jgi:hypothetical protein